MEPSMMDSPNSGLSYTLERKTQELYAAQKTIQALGANINHLESENSDLKTLLGEETRNREEADEALRSKLALVNTHKQQISDLSQDLDTALTKEKESVNLVSTLEQQLRQSRAHVERLQSCDAEKETQGDEDVEELQELVKQLMLEKDSLTHKLRQANDAHERKQCEISQLLHELKEKEEELEGTQCQFVTQCNLTEQLREEIRELKFEMEAEVGQEEVDTDKKGNSLFSEVEDRRIAAERKIVAVEQQLVLTKEQLKKSEKEAKFLKREIAVLRQSSNKGFDQGTVRDLQNQLHASKKTVLELTEKLNKREEKKASKRPSHEFKLPVAEGGGQDQDVLNYLQVVITDKEKKIQELKTTASREHVQMLHTELRLDQARNDLTMMQQEKDQLKAANACLSLEIRTLQHKYEPGVFEEMKAEPNQLGHQPLPLTERPQMTVNMPDLNNRPLLKQVSHPKSSQTSNLKENDPANMITSILCGKTDAGRGRGVRMMETVEVKSSEGEVTSAAIGAEEKSGRKLKKLASSKHKVVSDCTGEEAVECKQQ